MNKRISLFIFFSLFFLRLPAQKLNPYQDKYVRDVIAHQFYECANGVNFESGMANFFVIKRDTFFNPIGYHYLFQLKGDSIERIDYSIFHGGNFNRFSFTDSQNIYLLGGYGMFVTHNNLEAFDLKSKEWYIKATTGPKPPFVCGFTFKSGNYVYTFNNIKGGNNTEPDEFNKDIYRLDLKTFSWEKFENLNTNLEFVFNTVINRVEVFYTKDYFLNITGDNFVIINPKNLDYIILDKHGLKHRTYSFKIHGNHLYIKHKSSSEINENEQVFDIDSLYKTNQSIAVPLILTPNWLQIFNLKYSKRVYIILLLLLFVYVLNYLFHKLKKRAKEKKKIISPQTPNNEKSHPLIQVILSSSKTELSADELDALLGIDYMEQESRKMKRHRLIIQLNEIYPNLLSREKDQSDKRKTIFKVNKNETV
jgi:hypothetical protein